MKVITHVHTLFDNLSDGGRVLWIRPRFWGVLQDELGHPRRYETRAGAEASIREQIEIFYNRRRRHVRLGNLAAAVFAQNYRKQNSKPLEPGVSTIVTTSQFQPWALLWTASKTLGCYGPPCRVHLNPQAPAPPAVDPPPRSATRRGLLQSPQCHSSTRLL